MPRSPPEPRDRPPHRRIRWQEVLAAYALVAAIPLALWAVIAPLAAGAVIAASVIAVVGTRCARRLVRCVRNCRGVAVDLPGSVSVTIRWQQDCCPA